MTVSLYRLNVKEVRRNRGLYFLLIFLSTTFWTSAQELELVIPRGHTNPVTHITVSPDKKFILSSDGTNELIIWSATTAGGNNWN